jgi:hypothetical protein
VKLRAVALAAVLLASCSSSSDRNGRMPELGCQVHGTTVVEYMQGAATVRLTWQGWLMHGQSFPITPKGLQVPTPKSVPDGGLFEAVYSTREGKHIKALSLKCGTADHGLSGAILP